MLVSILRKSSLPSSSTETAEPLVPTVSLLYQNAAKANDLIKEIEHIIPVWTARERKSITDYSKSREKMTFNESSLIKNLNQWLAAIKAELTKTSDFANTQKIMELRQHLALLIPKFDLSETHFLLEEKEDYFTDPEDYGDMNHAYTVKITEDEAHQKRIKKMVHLLDQVMLILFEPALQLKVRDIADRSLPSDTEFKKEIKPIFARELNKMGEIDWKMENKITTIPEFKRATDIIISNFSFFMAVFNCYNPMPFQKWANKHKEIVKPYSDLLHSALFEEWKEEAENSVEKFHLVYQNVIGDIYCKLFNAAKDGNVKVINSLFYFHTPSNGYEKFCKKWAVAIADSSGIAVMDAWYQTQATLIQRQLESIYTNIADNLDFYMALFDPTKEDDFMTWLKTASVESRQLINALRIVFLVDRQILPELYDDQNNFEARLVKKTLIQQQSHFFEGLNQLQQGNELPLLDALYLGKGELRYLNRPLLQALVSLSKPLGVQTIREWRKAQLIKNLSFATSRHILLSNPPIHDSNKKTELKQSDKPVLTKLTRG